MMIVPRGQDGELYTEMGREVKLEPFMYNPRPFPIERASDLQD